MLKERKRQAEEDASRSRGESASKGLSGEDAGASLLNESDVKRLQEVGESSHGGKSSAGADAQTVNFNLT